MMEIELTQGFKAIVDDDDFDRVSTRSWSIVRPRGYIYAGARINNKYVYLHRFILGEAPFPGAQVDHINGNKLDCRKSNLRWATHVQNQCNKGKVKVHSHKASKFKGIHWCKQTGRWRAVIHLKKKKFHIGRFEKENDAALAYNDAAIKLHGEFARLNVF